MKRILVLLALCAVTMAGACGKKEQTIRGSAPDSGSSSAGVPGGTESLVSDQALVEGTLADVSHSKWDIRKATPPEGPGQCHE